LQKSPDELTNDVIIFVFFEEAKIITYDLKYFSPFLVKSAT